MRTDDHDYEAEVKDIFKAPKFLKTVQSRSVIYTMIWRNGFKINLEMYDNGVGFGTAFFKDKVVQEMFTGPKQKCVDILMAKVDEYVPVQDQPDSKPIDPFGIFSGETN
jgi:hypothetical protein